MPTDRSLSHEYSWVLSRLGQRRHVANPSGILVMWSSAISRRWMSSARSGCVARHGQPHQWTSCTPPARTRADCDDHRQDGTRRCPADGRSVPGGLRQRRVHRRAHASTPHARRVSSPPTCHHRAPPTNTCTHHPKGVSHRSPPNRRAQLSLCVLDRTLVSGQCPWVGPNRVGGRLCSPWQLWSSQRWRSGSSRAVSPALTTQPWRLEPSFTPQHMPSS